MTKIKTTRKPKIKTLDEQTSALVIAELLAITEVSPAEIGELEDDREDGHLTPRGCAIAIRMSEILDVEPPFAVDPRYQLALDRAQQYMRILGDATEERAS